MKSPRPEHTRDYARASGHLPHQGARERIRRIGGEQWAMYKRADRVFRGLDPMPAPKPEHLQQAEAYAPIREPVDA